MGNIRPAERAAGDFRGAGLSRSHSIVARARLRRPRGVDRPGRLVQRATSSAGEFSQPLPHGVVLWVPAAAVTQPLRGHDVARLLERVRRLGRALTRAVTHTATRLLPIVAYSGASPPPGTTPGRPSMPASPLAGDAPPARSGQTRC